MDSLVHSSSLQPETIIAIPSSAPHHDNEEKARMFKEWYQMEKLK